MREGGVMRWLFVVWACVVAVSAWGGDEIQEQLARFNAHAKFPVPVLTEAQLAKLRKGKLVRIRERNKDNDKPQRGIGLRIIPLPRDQLWAGAIDIHLASKGTASEVEIPREGPGTRWYQRLWLPWPFAHRHWVIDVDDSVDVAEATQGAAWEHYWRLTGDGPALAEALIKEGKVEGVTPRSAKGYVYTPLNRGAYFAIELSGGRTLWGFQASTVVGGNISEGLVADFTMMQLKGVFKEVVQRGKKVLEHYDASHAPILGGDGKELKRFR